MLDDGWPLFHGAHLSVDTTLVSMLGRNKEFRPCADVDGVFLEEAKRRKEHR